MSSPHQNPVRFLVEHVRKFKVEDFPMYTVLSKIGQEHCKTFTVKCDFLNHEVFGYGKSKKSAKTAAARAMVAKLQGEKYDFDAPDGVAIGYPKGQNPVSILYEHDQQQIKSAIPSHFKSKTAARGFVSERTFKQCKTVGIGTTIKRSNKDAAYKKCKELGTSEPLARDFAEDVGSDSEMVTTKPPLALEMTTLMSAFTMQVSNNERLRFLIERTKKLTDNATTSC